MSTTTTTTSILDPSETFETLFESVGLDARLRQSVARLGHTRPTLVQSKALPLAISSGRDLLVRSRTGSGKTLAYCLPLLQKLLQKASSKQGVGAVILVPTRELCTQVQQVLHSLIYYCDESIKVAVLSVGRGRGEKAKQEVEKQEAMLRDEPNVLVATPGGLLTHLRSGAVHLKTVETFCVDEADLVLSFGYSNDVSEIVKSLPRICQGFLLSATLSPELESLKKIVLHSPVVLKLEQDDAMSSTSQLKQFFLMLKNKNDKNLVIYVFLKLGLLQGKGLFFVNTTDAGYRLKLLLEQFHIRSAVLNAELPFRSRLNIIEQFNYGNFDYLIATDASTDVNNPQSKKDSDDADEPGSGEEDDEDEEDEKIEAKSDDKVDAKKKPTAKQNTRKKDSEYGVSRGLDFRNVSFVVNVDFPPNPRSYAHRVGRTARGGARGVALSLVQGDVPEQYETLLAVQQDQPPLPLAGASTDLLQAAAPTEMGNDGMAGAGSQAMPMEQPQPTPLDFDMREIEGFRYRVEDVSRAVTRIAVQEARAAELKAEILNSERLQSHFDDNPADLQLLRHDRLATQGGSRRVQDHLKHVPRYLLPKGAQVANLNRKRKKRRNKKGTGGARRTDNDPLQSFNPQGSATGADGEQEEGDDPFAEFMEDDDDGDDDNEESAKKKQKSQDTRIFANTRDGTGESTAGRNLWKEKHRKGKFSKKKRGGKARRGDTLGI